MSDFVTIHFDRSEFRCHDGTEYPREWLLDRLVPLCVVLEVIREACGGRPITILSGYRSPQHNAEVGGAKQSQHMEGRAADITVDGMAPSDVHAQILELFNAGKLEKLGGLGLYDSWVHLDVRPWQGHLCQWTGCKIGDEVA